MKRIAPFPTSLVVAALPLLALAGCQYPPGYSTPTFGEAVERNIALQVIEPEPELAPEAPDYDGNRAALMVSRYKVDEIDEPTGVITAGVGVALGE